MLHFDQIFDHDQSSNNLVRNYNRYKVIPVMDYFFGELLATLKLEREALQSVDLSPVIDEMVELIYRQPITLPVEWAFIGRAVGILSGIISTLNPEFKVSRGKAEKKILSKPSCWEFLINDKLPPKSRIPDTFIAYLLLSLRIRPVWQVESALPSFKSLEIDLMYPEVSAVSKA